MSGSADAPVHDTPATGSLERGVLGLPDAVAQSVALLSLALGVAFAASGAAGDAGGAAPLTYLVGGIAALCLASVVVRFARRFATVGGVYTYVAAAQPQPRPRPALRGGAGRGRSGLTRHAPDPPRRPLGRPARPAARANAPTVLT
jgi:hypothetical protein